MKKHGIHFKPDKPIFVDGWLDNLVVNGKSVNFRSNPDRPIVVGAGDKIKVRLNSETSATVFVRNGKKRRQFTPPRHRSQG